MSGAPSPWDESRPRQTKNEGFAMTFFLLAFWLFWLYVRPEDLATSLRHIPIAIGIFCFLLHMMNTMGSGKGLLTLSPMAVTLAVLTGWALFCLPFSFWVEGSLQVFLFKWGKMLLMFLLLGQVVSTIRQLRAVAWVGILGAAFVAAVAMAIHFTAGPRGSSGRLQAFVTGPYSGSNYLSITVLLMLPFVLFAFFVSQGILRRLWAGALCFIFATANLLTQSRAGAVAMVVIVVVTVYMLRKWGRSSLVMALALFLAGLPLLAVFGRGMAVRLAATAGDYDLNQLGTGSVLERTVGSTHKRLEVILKALKLTLQQPITGVGMGNFSGASAKTWSTGRGTDWVAPHNTYLQFSAELGVPGLLLYLTLLYSTFRCLRRVRRCITPEMLNQQDYRQLALLCDGATVSLIGYSLTSIFASVAYNSYFFFLAGIAQSLHRLAQTLPEPVKKKSRRPAPALWPAPALDTRPRGVTE